MSTRPDSNIKISSLLPYLFLFVGAPLFWFLSWQARGVDWWVWVAGGLFVASLAYVVAAYFLVAKKEKSGDWYRSLDRLAWFVMLAAVGGYLIRDAFALGTVYIENATPLDVRIMVDDEKWIDVPNHSTRKESLTRGTHIVSVLTLEGANKLDEHPAKVEGCGNYVLNIFGAQKFLRGEVVYDGSAAPEPRVIYARWFEVEPVDYLFAEPPKEGDGSAEDAGTRKTYFKRVKSQMPKTK